MTLFTSSSHSSSRPWLLQTTSLSPSCSSSHLNPSFLTISVKPQIPISMRIQYNSHSKTSASRFSRCCAAKQQTGSNSVKKRKTGSPKQRSSSKTIIEMDSEDFDEPGGKIAHNKSYQPASLPKPPAGFVLDPNGKVVMVSSKRMVTIVDSANNLPLECIIRRVFRSSQGDDCLLLCPVDTPVQILKSTNVDGWSAVDDEEVETILPAAAYALAKIHMHLVYSGYCYTARGGFCYSEEDIFEFGTDDGQDVDGLPTEGVQIACFHQDNTNYMIYTPSDPLLFVAVKDINGLLRIADDDLLEDSAIVDAIDEETEFNALVEEEAALLESLLEEE